MHKGPERMERVLHGAQEAGIWPELVAGLGSVGGGGGVDTGIQGLKVVGSVWVPREPQKDQVVF